MTSRVAAVLLLASAAFIFAGQSGARGESTWQRLAPDLEVMVIKVPGSGAPATIIAIRTVPSRIRIGVGAMRDAAGWRRATAARAVVNGGFFDPDGKTLGLRVARGRQRSRLRQADWGVFYVRNRRASIVHTREFAARAEITEAVQCGPRLVVNGRPVRLKPQWARRTGIGVQANGRVVLAVSDQAMLFKDWARLWVSPGGFNCPSALNLDGGSSSQLSLQTRAKAIHIGGRPVPDIVMVQ